MFVVQIRAPYCACHYLVGLLVKFLSLLIAHLGFHRGGLLPGYCPSLQGSILRQSSLLEYMILLYTAKICSIVQSSIQYFNVLFCTAQFCSELLSPILHCIALFFTACLYSNCSAMVLFKKQGSVLHYTILFCTAWSYSALHSSVLQCTVILCNARFCLIQFLV